MVEEGWLKMLRKRNLRKLKTADEENPCLKNPFQNQRDMSQIDVSIFSHSGKMQYLTNKQLKQEEAGFDVERD